MKGIFFKLVILRLILPFSAYLSSYPVNLFLSGKQVIIA